MTIQCNSLAANASNHLESPNTKTGMMLPRMSGWMFLIR